MIKLHALFNHIAGGVCPYVVEYGVAYARLVQCFHEAPVQTALGYVGPGDKKYIVDVILFEQLRHALYAAGAFDVVRHAVAHEIVACLEHRLKYTTVRFIHPHILFLPVFSEGAGLFICFHCYSSYGAVLFA